MTEELLLALLPRLLGRGEFSEALFKVVELKGELFLALLPEALHAFKVGLLGQNLAMLILKVGVRTEDIVFALLPLLLLLFELRAQGFFTATNFVGVGLYLVELGAE